MQIVYHVAASLDGYIADPDGGVDWLPPIVTGAGDYGYAQFFSGIDALLFGSRAYEQSLAFGEWPYGDKPCWVFTRRKLAGAAPGVALTSRSPAELAAELRERGIRRAWLVGGARLAGAFRAAGLIDEYLIAVIPVILGAGIPLFAGPGPQERLDLTEQRAYPDGVVVLRHLRRGAGLTRAS